MKNIPKICGIIIWTDNLEKMSNFFTLFGILGIPTKAEIWCSIYSGPLKIVVRWEERSEGVDAAT